MKLTKLSELVAKEVVSLKNGEKLGFVDDLELDAESKQVLSLIIWGRARFFGIFGRESDIVVPFSDIYLIGKDVILVRGGAVTTPM